MLLIFALEDYYADHAKKDLKYRKPNTSVVKHHFYHHDIGLPKQEVAVCKDSKEGEQDHHIHFLVYLRFVAAHSHMNTSVAKEGQNKEDGDFYKELALRVTELGQLEEKQCESDHDDYAAEVLIEV